MIDVNGDVNGLFSIIKKKHGNIVNYDPMDTKASFYGKIYFDRSTHTDFFCLRRLNNRKKVMKKTKKSKNYKYESTRTRRKTYKWGYNFYL